MYPVTVMPAAEVIAKYHDPVARGEVVSDVQSDLDARPMFNRVRDAIEAHLTIVFAALAISHVIQSRAAYRSPRPSRPCDHCAQRPSPSTEPPKLFPPAIPDHERKILTDLGFQAGVLKPNVQTQDERKILTDLGFKPGY